MTNDPPDPEEMACWRARLRVLSDGAAFATNSSWLQPVLTLNGEPAMLKLARAEYERSGGAVMAAWNGRGAARVLALDGDAVVLERLSDEPGLKAMAERGGDDEATRLACGVVKALHRTPAPAGLALPTLADRFRALREAAGAGAAFSKAWAVAERLLAEPGEVRLLHGDIHHDNILWSARRGWLAIDPQPLIGDRAYDYANLLKNPTAEIMLASGRLRRTAEVIAEAAYLELARVLAWGQAHAGLSAAWSLEDGFTDPAPALAVAQMARRELAESPQAP